MRAETAGGPADRIERLGRCELIQREGCFKLGSDALDLGRFATVRRGWRVCDLACGSGALGLLLLEREEKLSLTGVELDPAAAALARETGMWLHGGSIYEKNPQGGRPYNCTMVIRPDGTLAAKYRKLHPFDVTVPGGGQMRESSQICPGDAIVTVDAGELGTWGLSVCYDLRFGELYRIMALEGAQVLFVPANFTLNTGKDHWEVLLRARAIENGCYVVAPEQFGPGPEFPAYGRSMVVDPWGNVVAQAPDRPGVILADIDLDYVEEIRRKVGTLTNRRADRYRLERV